MIDQQKEKTEENQVDTEKLKQDSSDSRQQGKTEADDATEEKSEPAEPEEDWQKKYLYLYADFENFRKRTIKERSEFLKFGHEDFVRDLLQVVDNFERALVHIPTDEANQQILAGISMIMDQFKHCLEAKGVKRIEATGKEFDPNLHEAVGESESDQYGPGTIMKEELAGYTLHGRLLRAAKVITVKK